MAEATSWNEYDMLANPISTVRSGTAISIWMTHYADGSRPSAAMVETIGPASLIHLSRYARLPSTANFPASRYIVGDDGPDATGDVFTLRTWPRAEGETLPPGCDFANYQKVILQTPDGLYLAGDGNGYYHAAALEDDAAVFLLTRGGPVWARRAYLYPTFYPYGQRATQDPLLGTMMQVGLFSVQFVQPKTGGGVTANRVDIPLVDRGPLLLQQVQGTTDASAMIIEVMREARDLTMPFRNGTRLRNNKNPDEYVVYDGEIRALPASASANPFNFRPYYMMQVIKVPNTPYRMGSPIGADVRLATTPGQPEVWLLIDGIKRHVGGPDVMTRYDFSWTIQSVTPDVLANLPSGPPLGLALDMMPWPDGARLHENNTGKIYLVIDGQLRWIPNPATYNNLFADWDIPLDRNEVSADVYRTGPPITDGAYLCQSPPQGEVWLMIDGTKRHIASPAAMNRFNFDWSKVRTVPAETLAINQGPDINY